MIKLTITGVTGKNTTDFQKLNLDLIDKMTQCVISYVESELKINTTDILLVSGANPWTDYVAICLYLKYNFHGLLLCLPTKFNIKRNQFINSHIGRLLNSLHHKCKEKTKIDTLKMLIQCIHSTNCHVITSTNFFANNHIIAQNTDYLISFSFENYPKDKIIDNLIVKINRNNKTHIHFNLNTI